MATDRDWDRAAVFLSLVEAALTTENIGALAELLAAERAAEREEILASVAGLLRGVCKDEYDQAAARVRACAR